MMKYCLLLVLLIPQLAEVKNLDIKLEPGAELAEWHVPKEPRRLISTHPSQLRPYIEVTIEKVDYVIAYDEKTRRIKYISTEDEDFRTKKGLKVGDYIKLKRDEIVVFPSWEIRGPKTSDGWFPIIGVDAPGMNPVSEETFKENKTLKARIIGFSKGGN